MSDEKKEEVKQKPSAKEFGKMVVRESINLIVGMFFGRIAAFKVQDFIFRS
ncbi:MAG: hypothetical protein NTX00_04855 [Candidatus Parcubacteria bacterium]|nr:hypothetical protein [Candidatus Parcubacteria bacterium]